MTWKLEFHHIGGILNGEATIEPGLNAVQASNWQGKSSFVEAVQTALGVSKPLTEGAERGYVEFESPSHSGRVELRRRGNEVVQSGDPILADEYDQVRTALFACLGEQNEVRRAVREGKNLEEVLLRPLDFENIDDRIADLTRERDQIESEIERAREAKNQLPNVQERVTQLEAELQELQAERAELDAKADDDTEREQSTQQELAEAESERSRLVDQIERLESSVERTEAELESKEEELAEIEVPEETEIQAEVQSARERLQKLKRDKTVLESLHSATEMVLDENRLDLVTDVDREISGDTITCWTCGTETSRDDVEERLSGLRDRMATVQEQVDAQSEKVEELEARRERITRNRRREETLQSDIDSLREKLSSDRQSLDSARERVDELDDGIETLSESVEENREQITDVESEIKYTETTLEDARSELDELESEADRLDILEDELSKVRSEIESLRSRKSRIKRETREEFDAEIATIVDQFETGFESARLTPEFDLVVAREGREAALDALSEGELELLGFVAALAGFEAFDVGDVSPIMLVDGVGGLAEKNLKTLVKYLQPRTEYLVFTTFPEQQTHDGHAVDPATWDVASGT